MYSDYFFYFSSLSVSNPSTLSIYFFPFYASYGHAFPHLRVSLVCLTHFRPQCNSSYLISDTLFFPSLHHIQFVPPHSSPVCCFSSFPLPACPHSFLPGSFPSIFPPFPACIYPFFFSLLLPPSVPLVLACHSCVMPPPRAAWTQWVTPHQASWGWLTAMALETTR